MKIINLIKQEWKKIEDDRCIVKNNPEEQLKKCNDKLERIKKFKKEKLKNLKDIQTFNLNYAEIKKCIKDDEIIDDLCVSKKEKFDDSS